MKHSKRERSWTKAKVLISLTTLALTASLTTLEAQQFRVGGVTIDPEGKLRVQYPSDTSHYYILYRGDVVSNVNLALDMALGQSLQGEFTDPSVTTNNQAAFYRLRQVPIGQPLDSDADGIDDVYELRHRAFLNPLNAADAQLDFDHDGISNLDEFRGATDPTRPDTPSPIMRTPPTATNGSNVRLTGTAPPNFQLRVDGGASTVTGVAGSDGVFEINVPLQPNRLNRLFVSSINALGQPSAPQTVDIIQDSQPPSLFIDFPEDNAELTTSNIVVAGRGGDMLSGFMGLSVNITNISTNPPAGGPANVIVGIGQNGTFERGDVPLVFGTNIIVGTASDMHGNTISKQITVKRVPLSGPRMFVVSGDRQIAHIHARLAQPTVVRITQADGVTPFANKIVTFDVTRSDGRLVADPASPSAGTMTLQMFTDADGMASAWWTLGGDAGCGNNRVSVTSRDIAGTTFFCASAMPAPPRQINIGSGNNQRDEAGGSARESLRAWVSDSCNGVAGVPVTFRVIQGGGKVNGADSVTVETSITGHALVQFTLGPGSGNNVIEANFPGNLGLPATFICYGVARNPARPTTLTGLVLDNSSQPIGHALCEVFFPDAPTPVLTTYSDAQGRFTFTDAPTGPVHLFIYGPSATTVGSNNVPFGSFPFLTYFITVVPNAENFLPRPILLPRLNPNNAHTYYGTNDLELTCEGIAGLKMTIKANSMKDARGIPITPANPTIVSLNQVHYDKVPMAMPDGASPPFAWTLQPARSTFDPPVQIQYPNMAGLPAGAISYFLSFNHDTERFEFIASGHVLKDGSYLLTDPGVGISVAGWAADCAPYSATGPVCNSTPAACHECVNGAIQSKPNGTGCDDGDPCTINDRCQNGVCVGDLIQITSTDVRADGRKALSKCLGDTVSFSATVANMNCQNLIYDWSFGDGVTSTAESPTHSYSSSGKFTVMLKVTCMQCPSTEGYDSVEVTVVEIAKVQYRLNGIWTDVPVAGFNDVCKDSSLTLRALPKPSGSIWPDNQPTWGGDAIGAGEENTTQFSASGTRTITAKCGDITPPETLIVGVQSDNTATTITWEVEDYSVNAGNGNSTTVEKPFVVEWDACADIAANSWRLRVNKITGNVTIGVRTGGSRDPIANPPTTEAEAQDAVTVMKGYYTRGTRGSWHTEAASRAHEEHHYAEWKCSSEHYWAELEMCLEKMSVPYNSFATKNLAVAAMRNAGADTLAIDFKNRAHTYWFILADSAGSRPYAAGQLVLNNAIMSVQNLAMMMGWTVPLGVDTPSAANPCYEPFTAWNPCP